MAFKKLTLYITADSAEAMKNLIERRVSRMSPSDYELETVDVSREPERRVKDNISKVPALRIVNEHGITKDFYTFGDPYEISYALGLRKLW